MSLESKALINIIIFNIIFILPIVLSLTILKSYNSISVLNKTDIIYSSPLKYKVKLNKLNNYLEIPMCNAFGM